MPGRIERIENRPCGLLSKGQCPWPGARLCCAVRCRGQRGDGYGEPGMNAQ